VYASSRDKDSRKLNPVSCARPRSARRLRYKKGIYATRTDTHGNLTSGLYGIAREEGKRKPREEGPGIGTKESKIAAGCWGR
jgi:hypothetical protein